RELLAERRHVVLALGDRLDQLRIGLSRLPLGVGEVAGLQILALERVALARVSVTLGAVFLEELRGVLFLFLPGRKERQAERRDRSEDEAAENLRAFHPFLAFCN